MVPCLHLSLPVRSLEASVGFYELALLARVTHRDAAYVNLELAGAQLTLTESEVPPVADPAFHFGVNLPLEDFERVAAAAEQAAPGSLLSAPTLVDPGTPLERRKLYLRDPSGYRIELKGYRR